MDADYVSASAAFLAGVLTFASPCLLPLVPIYVSYLGGSVVAERGSSRRLSTLGHAALFVLGFSLIYVALGASFGFVGDLLSEHMPLLRKVGGLLIIALGVQLTGLISIPVLSSEKRFDLGGRPASSLLTSLLLGLVFGFAWTPCVGSTLLAISILASATETAWQGALLLATYSAGLAIPFLITAFALEAVADSLRKLNRHLHVVSMVSGALLIAIGLLVFFDQVHRLSGFLNSYLPL